MFDASHAPSIHERVRELVSTRMCQLSAHTAAVAERYGALHVSVTGHPIEPDATMYSADGLHGNLRSHAICAAESIRRLGLEPVGHQSRMRSQKMERTYPHGVPCWVDIETPDLEAAREFYGGLFGWAFENVMPEGAPGAYLIASIDGLGVAALGPGEGLPAWNTYIAVTDADQAAAAVASAGGTVTAGPFERRPGGRTATCADPEGATFRLWQPRRRPGAQLVNAPGTWNFSNLRTAAPKTALGFYQAVFGWESADMGEGAAAMLRVPGYGDHLAATADPGIYERQAAAGAPAGFADVIGAIEPAEPTEEPHWHVKFSVADRDASAATAERLGATILATSETPWTHEALIRDPQAAVLSLSQFVQPE